MVMKLGMGHYVFNLYKVYINDDPKLTLTYFMTMSNFGKSCFVLMVAQISGEHSRTISSLVKYKTEFGHVTLKFKFVEINESRKINRNHLM